MASNFEGDIKAIFSAVHELKKKVVEIRIPGSHTSNSTTNFLWSKSQNINSSYFAFFYYFLNVDFKSFSHYNHYVLVITNNAGLPSKAKIISEKYL